MGGVVSLGFEDGGNEREGSSGKASLRSLAVAIGVGTELIEAVA
jgi:hypothetical protein